jgi:protein TonB
MAGLAIAIVVAVLLGPAPQQAPPRDSVRQPRNPALLPGPMPPLRYGATMKAPVKIKDVRPVYPPEAKAAGISGVVILEGTIGIDGRVYGTKVLRSIAALDQAAVDAVRQWEFTPYELNGQLVPIVMTMTVNFARH